MTTDKDEYNWLQPTTHLAREKMYLSALALACSVRHGHSSEHSSSCASPDPGPSHTCSRRVQTIFVTAQYTDLVLHEAVYEGADPLLGQTLDVQRQAPLAQCVEPFARLEYL